MHLLLGDSARQSYALCYREFTRARARRSDKPAGLTARSKPRGLRSGRLLSGITRFVTLQDVIESTDKGAVFHFSRAVREISARGTRLARRFCSLILVGKCHFSGKTVTEWMRINLACFASSSSPRCVDAARDQSAKRITLF